MPRAFDITATTSHVELNGSSQGTVSFTISNKLGRGVTVRASVEPTDKSKTEWMSFPEGAERTLTADGTAVIPVKVAVAAGTPPGAYGFGLVVASLSNPDEHYDRSPAVAFEVKEAQEPVKKPFPWWMIALAAGVLLLVGGVVFALSSHKGAKAPVLGEACAKKGDACAEGLECGAGSLCLGKTGFKGCATSNQCITGRCEATECKEQGLLGDSCNGGEDCQTPLACVPQGLCLIPLGKPCSSAPQCVTGACQGSPQVCTQPVLACSPACTRGQLCIGGRCSFIRIDRDVEIYQKLGIDTRAFRPR